MDEKLSIAQFREYAAAVNQVVEPMQKRHRAICIALCAALIITNGIWGANFAYLTAKSYEPEPQKVSFAQDFENQSQNYENHTGGDYGETIGDH